MKLFFKLFFFLSTFPYSKGHATDLYIYTAGQNIETISIKIALRNEDVRRKSFIKAALLERGKFFASWNEEEPQYVFIAVNDSLYTEPFFLDNQAAKIDIIVDKDLNLEIKNSTAQDEYITAYNPALEGINKEIADFFTGEYRAAYIKYKGQLPDSVNNRFDSVRFRLREKRFGEIKDYIKKHPDSYVAMWKLLEEIEIYGYKEKLAESYDSFSERLKTSAIGKIAQEKLAIALSLEPGNRFPDFPVKDMNLKIVQLKPALQARYVLVDFWYSNCYPCIEQFPALKRLYESYPRNQFVIVSISVDKLQDANKWKQTIAKYDLPFLNYLDAEGTESYSKLNIVKFPTNFLLDSNGEILAKDIAPAKLKTLLEKEP